MNTAQFLQAYRESRNGASGFHFNKLYPKFKYSSGVKECAEAGCYWLLDILGSELPSEFKKHSSDFADVTVVVAGSKAIITTSFGDNDPIKLVRKVNYTDMPEGIWVFFVCYINPSFGFACILPSEY